MRHRLRAALGLAVATGFIAGAAASPGFVAGPARAASFDCARAASPAERALCSDPGLSALDAQLGAAYARRVARDPALRQLQRGWLKARDVGCGGDRGCLRRLISWQLGWLSRGSARPPARLPTSEGACSLTAISRLGSRLEGDPASGSAAEETNGADQVSYELVAPIQASRVGDPALVCLVSLPRHCPPGDERGKVYAVANLRTLGAWSLADAEHLCGGA